ncbi:MAG: lipoyl(octanoyl) transferase LipB [Bdellovibrionaceae bacterium]|nr:lipoyl(octanoyl) transferase LipB [Pseudobdellovibrionaceae bacterium]
MAVGQELQKEKQDLQDMDSAYILGCEHEAVLSVGRSLWKDYEERRSDWDIRDHDMDMYLVSRGGKLTIHNPGQLTIYPIMNIKKLQMGIKDYLEFLFKVTQKTFLGYGIKTEIDFEKNYGMYIESKKIVSAGLSYSQGWVGQGLSINLQNDLEIFKTIDVCGMSCMQMTSAQKLGYDITPAHFFTSWLKNFSDSAELKI